MARRSHRRTLGVAAMTVAAVLALTGCSATGVPADLKVVTSAELLPQTLFPTGGTVAECPVVAEDAPKDTVGGVPKAVCITVENTGDDRAVYTVNVDVQTRDDEPITISQVALTTQPIEPGASGSVAAAAPGAEKVIDEYADGQKEAQEAAGLFPAEEVQVRVTNVVRTAA